MSKLPSIPPTAPGDTLDIPFPLSTTIGALEIGVLFTVFLFGVLTVQMYIYFDRFPKDPLNFKVLVLLVWILDFGHTIAMCHLIYTITISQYGQLALLAVPPKSLDVCILLSGLIGPLEQGWFTYRLYKFTRTLPLPALCAILSLSRLGGSTALFVCALKGPSIQEYATQLMWLIEFVVIVGAALDVLLAVALCYYLSFWRADTFRRQAALRLTNKLVNQLMTWTIETGAITTTGALALVLTFLTMKDNCAARSNSFSIPILTELRIVVYLGVFCLMAKLFSNSLLFSLNARERFARICAEAITIPGLVEHTTRLMSLQSLEDPSLPVGTPKWPLRIRTDITVIPTDRRQSDVTCVASPMSARARLFP
ncbi:hypothetical protein DFH08DRAFT_1027710 [Mycena albidolilacea]|uniref:DUF6534 domain-containing protein n=1 Tax=Mycena albidolilacea TaxID=1033008 RepID=A0AAD6ZJC7_9AGAR|nr:hypothetical protein DFH08DRAFT_1027710 [Mycena albidolilacea]